MIRHSLAIALLLATAASAQEITRFTHGSPPPSYAVIHDINNGHTAIKPEFTENPNGVTVRVETGPADFYGGGEVTGPLRRNSTTIELWNHDNYRYLDHGGKRLYQSHPWAMGVRRDGSSFGVLFDTTYRAFLSMREHDVEFRSTAPALNVYVIEGKTPQEVVRGLARLTGTTPLPPRWALGYHQCRYSYAPDSEVRRIALEFRKRHIPCDVLWMDIDYMRGYRIFTFDPEGFPDPKGLNDFLHEHGFKGIWMIDPGVKKEPGYFVFDQGSQRDVWVKDTFGQPYVGKVWPGDCQFPDFTRSDVRQWWAGLYDNFAKLGVDGVWNDMNEPAVFEGVDKSMPVDNRHENGSHLQFHNVYGMTMARGTREGMQAARPDKRPFVLTRANFIGGQRYAATWTGDNESSWDHLKLSVPMSLTLGLSGQPFSGPDLGGFALDATPDLWGNWVGHGAFLPFCRAHSSKDTERKEPWSFGPEVEKAARTALQRRYRLLPYFYTLFERSSRTGDPVMQPVFFADPADVSLRTEQQAFMVGEDLLVVPRWALNPKLPKGGWVDILKEDGPYQARLLQRAGSVIPLGSAIESTDQPSQLTLSVCPDANGRAQGDLYLDEGDGYKPGQLLHLQAQDGRLTPARPDWKIQWLRE